MHTNPFATEAAQYAHLRPTYPDELFDFLSTTVASREVAWDCATGNGQAATHLARYFERVIATDESAEMIAQAPRDPRIEYRIAEAEDSGIEAHSVDLVTVASAIHWFDLSKFYMEVRRVVKPGRVIAVWTYYTPVFGNDIDAIIKRLAKYRQDKGARPTDLIRSDLTRVWGDPEQKQDLHFPLYMRSGRV